MKWGSATGKPRLLGARPGGAPGDDRDELHQACGSDENLPLDQGPAEGAELGVSAGGAAGVEIATRRDRLGRPKVVDRGVDDRPPGSDQEPEQENEGGEPGEPAGGSHRVE